MESSVALPHLNFGLGNDYSIEKYCRAVAYVVGFEGGFEHDLNKPVGMRQKLEDISHLESIRWTHKIKLIDGIKQAYEFCKEDIKNEI